MEGFIFLVLRVKTFYQSDFSWQLQDRIKELYWIRIQPYKQIEVVLDLTNRGLPKLWKDCILRETQWIFEFLIMK